MPRFLKDIRIDEVSSVDRGAGRRVRVLLMKRDGAEKDKDGVSKALYSDVDTTLAAGIIEYLKREFSQDERDKLADKGHALPDGSFPIVNRGDLKNAVQAIGRAKDPAKAKAHIKARAKALGAEDELPDSWGDGGSVDKAITAYVTTRDAAAFAKRINKIMEPSMSAEDTKKLIDEAVAKAVADVVTKKDHEILMAKMSDKHKAFHAKLSEVDKKKFEDLSPDEREKWWSKEQEEDTEKRLRSDPILKAMHNENDRLRKQAAEDRARVQKLEDAADLEVCKADARTMGLRDDDAGTMLQKARRGDRDALKKLEAHIARINKAMEEQAKTGVIFAEFGKRTERTGGASAYDELVAKGEELRKAQPTLTKEQAFAKAVELNGDLVKREAEERLAKIQGRSA